MAAWLDLGDYAQQVVDQTGIVRRHLEFRQAACRVERAEAVFEQQTAFEVFEAPYVPAFRAQQCLHEIGELPGKAAPDSFVIAVEQNLFAAPRGKITRGRDQQGFPPVGLNDAVDEGGTLRSVGSAIKTYLRHPYPPDLLKLVLGRDFVPVTLLGEKQLTFDAVVLVTGVRETSE